MHIYHGDFFEEILKTLNDHAPGINMRQIKTLIARYAEQVKQDALNGFHKELVSENERLQKLTDTLNTKFLESIHSKTPEIDAIVHKVRDRQKVREEKLAARIQEKRASLEKVLKDLLYFARVPYATNHGMHSSDKYLVDKHASILTLIDELMRLSKEQVALKMNVHEKTLKEILSGIERLLWMAGYDQY